MDCRPPGSSIHGILQARTLEWVAIPFSRGSSQTGVWTRISHIAGRFFTCLSHQGSKSLEWDQITVKIMRQLYLLSFYSQVMIVMIIKFLDVWKQTPPMKQHFDVSEV